MRNSHLGTPLFSATEITDRPAARIKKLRHCDCPKAFRAVKKRDPNWWNKLRSMVPVETTDGLCDYCGKVAPWRDPDNTYYEPTEQN